jgi:hypothetical protein
MNEDIINLFGATHISSGVEAPHGTAEMKAVDNDTNNVPLEDMPDAASYHEIMTEEFEANDTRIAMIGNVDSGKSTLIGVLTNATLDDGRGAARGMVLKHRHEQENGRTSAVTVEIMGYKGPTHCPVYVACIVELVSGKSEERRFNSIYISPLIVIPCYSV